MTHLTTMLLFVVFLPLASCMQQNAGTPCPAFVSYGPQSTLDYPSTTSTGVPDNVGCGTESMVYAGNGRFTTH